MELLIATRIRDAPKTAREVGLFVCPRLEVSYIMVAAQLLELKLRNFEKLCSFKKNSNESSSGNFLEPRAVTST